MPAKKKIRPTLLTELLSVAVAIAVMVWLFSVDAPPWLKGIVATIAILFWISTELGLTPALVTLLLQKTEENRGRNKSDIFWKVTYEDDGKNDQAILTSKNPKHIKAVHSTPSSRSAPSGRE